MPFKPHPALCPLPLVRRSAAARVRPATARWGWAAMALSGALMMAALPLSPAMAADAAATPAAAASGPTLRPEVHKPLLAANQALKAGQPAQALAQLKEAEAVGALEPYESYLLRRMKATALLATSDHAAALPLFEALVDDPLLPAADRPAIVETSAQLAMQVKDWARAKRWLKLHVDAPGAKPELVRAYPQVLYASGDFAEAARLFGQRVASDEAAGRKPDEGMLRLMASSQGKTGDEAGYVQTLRKLAVTTSKPEYFQELLQRVAMAPGFDREAWTLDLYRLRRAMGQNLSADEVSDMAFRAERAGLPGEAAALLDQGLASGLLGSHRNAAADRQLLDKVRKAAAADRAALATADKTMGGDANGKALFGLGLSAAGAGETAQGLALMRKGMDKGGLGAEAGLRLGLVQHWAGQNDAARQTFQSVQGPSGLTELARLWVDWLAAGAPRASGN